MREATGPVSQFYWRDWFSRLRLLTHAVRLALGARVLLLAVLGLVLSAAGSVLLAWLFADAVESPTAKAFVLGADWPWYSSAPSERALVPDFFLPNVRDGLVSSLFSLIATPFMLVRMLFDYTLPWQDYFYFLLRALWMLAVWAWIGGAITRIAAVNMAREDRPGLRASLRYAGGKWLAYVAAPLFPLVGVFLLTLPLVLLGLVMRANVGVLLAGLAWPLALLAGMVMAVMLVGLAFGWPLMWATISAEGTDSFDAMSRSYSYVFQRPLHYLLFVLLAVVLGALAALFIGLFLETVVQIVRWGVSWGSGNERLVTVLAGDLSGAGGAGQSLLRFFDGLVLMLASAFAMSYLWCAATAVYFLLRYEVDQTELDEVAVDPEEETYGLPPLQTDAAGVPQVADFPPPASSEPPSTLPGDDLRQGPPP